VFGVKARRAVQTGTADNRGLALGGLVLSIVATLLSVVAVVLLATGVVSV
jgi:hypothetical protein